MAKTVNGRERTWQLTEVIGSGDAGEVLRVYSQTGNLQAVMKRPVQNVSGGTIVRQASQIETEGKILLALDGINFTKNGLTIHTPDLLDQSIEGTSKTANLFIVSEEVQGRSITSLLSKRHEGGEQIPQNIILKVLSSALMLLEKVHEKGVIWNDVKADHIFWHEAIKRMSFIDWGNGIFFQPQQDIENSPIWQDYQQLFDEGTNLLNQTYPNLINDLSWPPTSTGLDLQDIKQLQLRVDYLEMYLSMRAIEYQLLFQRFSKHFADSQSLQQTLELQKELRNFGIMVESEIIFSSSELLLLDALRSSNFEETERILNLLTTSLGAEMPRNWTVTDFLLQSGQFLPANDLIELAEAILRSDWVESIWLARTLIQKGYDTTSLGKLIYSLRNLQLQAEPKTIYAEILSLADTLSSQASILAKQTDAASQEIATHIFRISDGLTQLSSHWAQLRSNEALGEKFLQLKQWLTAASNLRLKIPHALNDQLQKAMILIREIYQAWSSADIVSATKAVKKLYAAEPSLDYLLDMAKDLTEMQSRIDSFLEGPTPGQTIVDFAQEVYDYQSPLTDQINRASWQSSYNQVLSSLMNAVNLEQVQDLAKSQNWPIAWINQSGLRLREFSTIPDQALEQEQQLALATFHKQLRHSDPASLSTEAIKRLLLFWHAPYKQLVEEFLFAFSSIPREKGILSPEDFPVEDRSNVNQAMAVIEKVSRWKEIASSGDWYLLKATSEAYDKEWSILSELFDTTKGWNSEVLPALTELKQRNWNAARFKQVQNPRFPALSESQSHLFSFVSLWNKIEYQGLFPDLLNDLSYHIDQAQASFFQFWQRIQHADSRATVWLSNQQQSVFSDINQSLLTLMRSVRSLQRNFDVVNQSSMARTRLAQNSAGDLVFTLIRIDELIHPHQKENSIFRRWQRQYLDLLTRVDRDSIRRGIQEVESIHPLLPWFDELAKRDAGYFEQANSQ